MPPTPLPWVPDAARDLLLADPVFSSLLAEARVLFEDPPDVTTPYAVIQATVIPLSGDGVGWLPLVQVNGCSPKGRPNPRAEAWAIATAAAVALGRSRNVTYQTMSYSGRHTDGPLPDVDTTRGTSSPIYRAIIRAELKVHTT